MSLGTLFGTQASTGSRGWLWRGSYRQARQQHLSAVLRSSRLADACELLMLRVGAVVAGGAVPKALARRAADTACPPREPLCRVVEARALKGMRRCDTDVDLWVPEPSEEQVLRDLRHLRVPHEGHTHTLPNPWELQMQHASPCMHGWQARPQRPPRLRQAAGWRQCRVLRSCASPSR